MSIVEEQATDRDENRASREAKSRHVSERWHHFRHSEASQGCWSRGSPVGR
jgi:hypothetical protein